MKTTLTIIFLFIIIFSSFGQSELYDSNIKNQIFLNNDKFIVLELYATWCAPCKVMKPIIKEISNEIKDIEIYKIDIDKNTFDDPYHASGTPTYLFIKNKEILHKVSGGMSKTKMKNLITQYKTPKIIINSKEYYLLNSREEYTDGSYEIGTELISTLERLEKPNWKYKHGEWKTFYKTGELKVVGNYDFDDEIGKFKYYNKQGDLTAITSHNKSNPLYREYEIFKNGILRQKGQSLKKSRFRDFKKHGKIKTYDENNQLLQTEIYDYGILKDKTIVIKDNKNLKLIENLADEKINWISMTNAEAEQNKNPKMLIIAVYSDHYNKGTDLEKYTKNLFNKLNLDDVAKFVNKNYHLVKFNIYGKEKFIYNGVSYSNPNYQLEKLKRRYGLHDFMKKHNVKIYPSLLFFDESKNLLMPAFNTNNELKTLEMYLKFFASGDYKKIKTKDDWESYKSNFKPVFNTD